ncbi:MAG: sigma-70 family RNA polymerase sigma factor [Phycisphaerae bacterium]
MRAINNPHLAQLLMQMKFVSPAKRSEYLKSAQEFFYTVDPAKQYPFDYVVFRITKYHPKDLPDELINGNDLIEDLQIFIWKLSGKVDEKTAEQKEKVYSISELAESLNVSSKTIARWRNKGLLARKYVFKDGKKRLAVLQSELERFLESNPKLVQSAASFERLTEQEKERAVMIAREIAKTGKQTKRNIIKAVADALGRGHETIRILLTEYDQGRQRGKIFKSVREYLKPEDKKEIYRLYKQGVSAKELVKQFGRCKAEIYRIINQKKAKELSAVKIEYIPSPEFSKGKAFEKIASEPLQIPPRKTNISDKLQLDGSSLNRYLQSIKNIERLTRDRETYLFRRYNYLKYLASTERGNIKTANTSGRLLNSIEKYLNQAEEIKKIIIESNLGLVVSIASKHSLSGTSLGELISEGNMALMRAVEKFDYTKGFRFATYVSWIITKDFARKIPQVQDRSKSADESLENVQKDLRISDMVDFGAIDRARSSLVQVIKNELDEREQYIILRHYGLMSQTVLKTTKTLKEIGDELGLTAERVRQIELTALQKLKQSLSVEEFEMLTG